MTEADEDDLAVSLNERAEKLALYTMKENEESQELEAWLGNRRDKLCSNMYAYYRLRMACRADCGEKNPMKCCSKCKMACYCSASCQSDDVEMNFPFPKNTNERFERHNGGNSRKCFMCGIYIKCYPQLHKHESFGNPMFKGGIHIFTRE